MVLENRYSTPLPNEFLTCFSNDTVQELESCEAEVPDLDVVSEQKILFTFKISQSHRVVSLQLMLLSAMFEL